MGDNINGFYASTANAISLHMQQEMRLLPAVHFNILGAANGPRVLTLSMAVNPRYARQIAGMAEQFSMACRLNRGVSVRIGRGRSGTLAVEIPKPKTLWYDVSVSRLPRRRFLSASVGIDDQFRPALVNFSDPLTPHALLAGTTGSGKTNAARLIVFDLVSQNEPDDLKVILIQTVKGGAAWTPFAQLPHLAYPVIVDDRTAWKVLAWAVAEISQRGREKRTKPEIFVFIDEVQVLLAQKHFVRPIVDIAAIGREFGIHLIAATQNPTKEQLGDMTFKRTLTVRLVGRVDSPAAANVATGQSNTMAHTLAGAGDMLLVTPGDTRRITTALVGEHNLAGLPRVEALAAPIDLAVEDGARLPDVQAYTRADPFEPEQIGTALALNYGLNRLQREFSCGPAKAQRIKEFADGVRGTLARLGYSVAPILPEM